MTLTNNNNYNFYSESLKIITFLDTNSFELYDISDIITSVSPNDSFIKVYINFRNKTVVVHKPVCPDKPNLISGFGDASENGFWIGMLEKAQVNSTFGSFQNFANSFGQVFNINQYSTCKRCRV